MGNKKILLSLDDLLTSDLYFNISKRGRREIIKTSNNTLPSIGNRKRKPILTLLFRLNKNMFMRGDNLRFLLDEFNLSVRKFEANIVSIKRGNSGYNNPVEIKLPLKPTPELSLLISKCLGDGSVCSDWRFVYSNVEKRLINEVIECSRKCIGKSVYKVYFRRNRIYEIKFPSVLGFLLVLMGASRGLKVKNRFRVPEWIMSGNKEIKSAFIKGIYDDESCVNYSQRSRRIILAMGKYEKHIDSLINFLNDIKALLNDNGIESGKINFQQKVKNTVILRFVIYRKVNFEKFQKCVGFSHPKKQKMLTKICNSYN
ncbi:MAG: hypothetical protein ABIJ92_03830 [Candidatus Aenigmatarchaeota archaeon]